MPVVHAIQILSPAGLQSNSIPLPVVAPVVPATEPSPLEMLLAPPDLVTVFWPSQFGVTGPGTRSDVFRGLTGDLRGARFASGACFAEDVFVAQSAIWFVIDSEIPPLDDAFYYVARSENQFGVTTWGNAQRDSEINGSAGACSVRFP